jgi:hypothetical protein
LAKVQHKIRLLILACLGLVLLACGTQGQLLNSERIARTFGSYGVDVLQASSERRVSSLYSVSGDDKITRTFAVVKFSGPARRAFASEHSQVEAGQSLGVVFKSAGWEIEKNNIFIGEMEIPRKYGLLSELMQIDLPKFLAAHVYQFVIRKDGRSYDYATIVELHHPDYLSAEDLEAVYGEIIFDDSDRTTVDDYIDPGIWEN